MPLLIRLLVNAAALWVATRIVTGVTYSGALLPFLGVALVFGVVNAFIRPLLKLVTFPLIIVTFGHAFGISGFVGSLAAIPVAIAALAIALAVTGQPSG